MGEIYTYFLSITSFSNCIKISFFLSRKPINEEDMGNDNKAYEAEHKAENGLGPNNSKEIGFGFDSEKQNGYSVHSDTTKDGKTDHEGVTVINNPYTETTKF